ncbi:MAG: alpha/beta hydrolase [Planctomycetota bacterium]
MPRGDGGVTRGWWIPNPGSDAAVVLFGGNSGNRSHHLAYARIAWNAGFSVLMPEYQGFGPDGGEPSISAFGPDGEAAVAWAAGKSGRVGVWGVSLGSAVALHSAAARPEIVKAVCVEGAFRMAPAMRHYMAFVMPAVIATPLAILTRALIIPGDADPENSVARIAEGVPVLFLHGDCDELTCTAWAGELFERTPGRREFWMLDDTGHAPEPLRSCDGEYQEQIGRFFRRELLGSQESQAAATWTARRVEEGWEIDIDVVCEGPFPAAVEVDAIGTGGTARERIWMSGPRDHVAVFLHSRPVSASARRWTCVEYAGGTWRPDRTAISGGYRWLRRVSELTSRGKPPVAELLAARVDKVLGPAYTSALVAAGLVAVDAADSRALFLRALETAQEKPTSYILGNAVYYEPTPWSRAAVAEMLPGLFQIKGIDARPLDEKLRALPAAMGDK